MALKLFLKKANAHTFVKLLTEQAQHMDELHAESGDVRLWHNEWGERGTTDLMVASTLSEDGWLYQVEVLITPPDYTGVDTLRLERFRDDEGCLYLLFEVTPLGQIHGPNISVRIDYDPSKEFPEVLPYVVELLEPTENAWGGVMQQLADRSPVLARAIREKLGAEPAPTEGGELEAQGLTPSDTEAGKSVQPEAQPAPSLEGQYTFRKSGQVWVISYRDKGFHLEDCKGLGCIHEMLARPNYQFKALELEIAVEGTPVGEPVKPEEREWLDGETDGGDDYEQIDEQAKQEVEEAIVGLEQRKTTAEQERNQPAVNELEDEIEQLKRYLAAGTALSGKSRTFVGEPEKARQRVQKAIKNAIETIAEHSPELGDHLREHVETGYRCSYRIPRPNQTPWEL